MSTAIQRRRGTTAQHSSFTGLSGELTVDTDKKTVVVHDGTTAGGFPLARQDLSNLTSLAVGAGTAAAPTYAFTGSTTSGLYSPGANQVGLATNGTARLTIDASGNISVPGTLTTTGTSTAASFIPSSSTAPSNGLYLPALNSVALATGGSGRLFIDNSGRVGVGVSSVDSDVILQTKHSATSAYGFRVTNNSGTNNITLGASDPEVRASGAPLYLTTATSQPIIYRVNSSEVARFDTSGRLGIGTSSPSSLLSLNQSSAGLYFSANASNSSRPLEITSSSTAVNGDTHIFNVNSIQGRIGFATNGSTALFIDNSQRVGIGTTAPSAVLDISSGDRTTTGQGGALTIGADSGATTRTNNTRKIGFINVPHYTNATGKLFLIAGDSQSATNDIYIGGGYTGYTIAQSIQFHTNSSSTATGASEVARIDSSGRLLVGTSTSTGINPSNVGKTIAPQIQISGDGSSTTAAASLQITDTANSDWSLGANIQLIKDAGSTAPGNGWTLGGIFISGEDTSGTLKTGASIVAKADGQAWLSGDCPTRLEFSTTADGASSPTERMRIDNAGRLYIATTSTNPTTGVVFDQSSSGTFATNATNVSTNWSHWSFKNSNGIVGQINTSGSATSYTTSSDYRLKENVVPLTGASDRVNQLQVHRFNFIADPDKTVDGFIAHEAQVVVPECVTGTKDEVDADGNPVYQGIDQSKLVPLLTAALQEALAEIESLKARVTALEP